MLSSTESFQKLNALVKDKGISFYALRKELNFSSSFFSEWKRGKMMPKNDKLIELAKFFDIQMEYFIKEEVETG